MGAKKPRKKRQSAETRLASKRRARLRKKIQQRLAKRERKSETVRQIEQRIAEARVTDPGLSETIQQRTHYDEVVPGAFETFYHLNLNTKSNALPAGYYSSEEDDEFNPEELLEPEDQPWL